MHKSSFLQYMHQVWRKPRPGEHVGVKQSNSHLAEAGALALLLKVTALLVSHRQRPT